MSAFDSRSALRLQRIWGGVHGRVLHGGGQTVSAIELDPNTVVPEHSHDQEQLGMCISGSLLFRVDDESRELGPGETWSIPGNVPHEVHGGPAGAVVIDVFPPTRDDWRKAPNVDARPPRWP